MTGGPLPDLSEHDLVQNPRGLAFAAFGSIAGIKLLLGCDDATAEMVQAQSLSRWHGIMARAAQAKRVAGIKQ